MTATIRVRRSQAGTVNIATVTVGRKVLHETRAWGTVANAVQDAQGWAKENGYAAKVKQ